LHGITGTNGKTTTVYMFAHILRKMGRRVAFWSTNQVEGIASPFRPSMTTPEAPDLHRFLREAWDRGAQDVVLEVSSHGLELSRVGGLSFRCAAITNITPDHLDFHESFASYVRAKARMKEHLASPGLLAVNADDPVVMSIAAQAPVPILPFGFSNEAQLCAEVLERQAHAIRFRLSYRGQVLGTSVLPVPGDHNVMNAMAAIAMALELGLAPGQAASILEDFVAVTRRLETLRVGPVTLISDVAMNQASYDAVMRTAGALKEPLVVVNALRGNRGPVVNQEIAEVLATWDASLHFAPVIVTASQARVHHLSVDYRVRHEECDAFMRAARARGLTVDFQAELEPALRHAVDRLDQGGILLLLGTFGMDDGLSVAQALLRAKFGSA
jgi:UDP-N-acetylmuramoyl-L-alanyl-D-glutamate--2,6-diaminopimelate ligase